MLGETRHIHNGLPMTTVEFRSETTGQLTLVAARLISEIRAMTETYTSIHLVHGQVLVVQGAESDVRARLSALSS